MMLHTIREKAKGWFAWVIVILISVPFALWGIGSYITPDPNPAIALVDDAKVSSYEFQNELQREQQQLQNKSQNLDETLLKKKVLERLINNQALLNHLTSLGYITSRSSLNNQIINEQAFVDQKTGQFSEDLFKQVLQRMGLSFNSFKQQLGDDMLVQQYTKGINQSVWVSKQEVDSIVGLLKQKRDISYILIDSEQFVQQSQPKDEEIKKYYQENQENYEVPEKLKLSYIEISRKEIARTIEIADADVEQYYNDNTAKYTEAEQRKASHILIPVNKNADDEAKNKAQQQIDDIYARLKAGEDFAALAKEYSKDPGSAKNGGDLGFFKKGAMVPEFEKVAYELKVDEMSEPFLSPFGFHIIRLTAIKPAKVKPLTDVKNKIVEEIQFDRAEKIYFEKTELLQTIAYEQPDSLEPASTELGIAVKESPLVSRNGGNGIFKNKKLITAAFDEQVLESGNNSDLIEVGTDHVVAVRLKEKFPASIKPLDEVKEDIIKTLATKTAGDKAYKLATSLSEALSEQQDIQAQLTEHKLQMIEAGLVERDNIMVDRDILLKAFSMPRVKDKPEYAAFRIAGNKAVVVAVKQVENGTSDDDNFVQMVSNSIKLSRASLYSNMAVMQTRKNAKVEINQQRLSGEEE